MASRKKKAVVKSANSAIVADSVPDYLSDYSGQGTETVSELTIIPRVKLLQGLSPEVVDGPHKSGTFFHSIAEESMGTKVQMVPIFIYQSYILWRPRPMGGGILARADDGVHWNRPNEQFEIKLGNKTVHWDTGDTVQQSGLGEFGSSDPGDQNSLPAATRMINIVSSFPELPDFSPSIVTLQKASLPVGRKLVSKLGISRAPSWGRLFSMSSWKHDHSSGPFMDYRFESEGFVAKDEVGAYKDMYTFFKSRTVAASDIESAQDEGEINPDSVSKGNY